MKDQRGSRSLPVLLGMALSLLVLIVVVNRSYAATECGLCLRNAFLKAESDCGGKAGMIDPVTKQPTCYYMMYKFYEHWDCYVTKICPNGKTITGSADCGSPECRGEGAIHPDDVKTVCGQDADPQSGAVCSNGCWGKSCNEAGQCFDVQVDSDKVISLCHVKCGCSQ